MIEIVTPAMQTLIVDRGRYGHCAVGVPPSAALDGFAYAALNRLTGQAEGAPVLEVIGSRLAIRFGGETACAITGAIVKATLNDQDVPPWTAFQAGEGDLLRVRDVRAGFRYYVGFSGTMILDRTMGSYTTNLECRFGGYQGRALAAGDRIKIEKGRNVTLRSVPGTLIPPMDSPHILRVIEGPEFSFFQASALAAMTPEPDGSSFTVSGSSNRTGIRLTGTPFAFKDGAEKSIISEGILAGDIQVPGDGQPIIMLYERSIGGYARIASVIRADRDRLAHLKPGHAVALKMIGLEEAERLQRERAEKLALLDGV